MLCLHKRLTAEQLPQRREQIQREIDASDRQTDQFLYHLLGLPADAIAMVEAARDSFAFYFAPLAAQFSRRGDRSPFALLFGALPLETDAAMATIAGTEA